MELLEISKGFINFAADGKKISADRELISSGFIVYYRPMLYFPSDNKFSITEEDRQKHAHIFKDAFPEAIFDVGPLSGYSEEDENRIVGFIVLYYGSALGWITGHNWVNTGLPLKLRNNKVLSRLNDEITKEYQTIIHCTKEIPAILTERRIQFAEKVNLFIHLLKEYSNGRYTIMLDETRDGVPTVVEFGR
ncbi:MAG: hypothetical protein LBQ80_03250 [Clostridium sp.]|jgi:hypothetical protein|nr:hypothetical protein [Clostridium sp.]